MVKGSPQFENKSIQVGALFSSNQDEVHFCEYSGQNKPQDFEVAVEKEVKLASAVNENNIVDVSESKHILSNESKNPVIPSCVSWRLAVTLMSAKS